MNWRLLRRFAICHFDILLLIDFVHFFFAFNSMMWKQITEFQLRPQYITWLWVHNAFSCMQTFILNQTTYFQQIHSERKHIFEYSYFTAKNSWFVESLMMAMDLKCLFVCLYSKLMLSSFISIVKQNCRVFRFQMYKNRGGCLSECMSNVWFP